MTHQIDSDLLTTVLQLLTNEASSGFAEGLRLLVNEAMLQERSAVLQARPYERCDARLGRLASRAQIRLRLDFLHP